LSASQPTEATTYVVFVGQLSEQFKTRFEDLHANSQDSALFAMQHTDLKIKFTEVAIVWPTICSSQRSKLTGVHLEGILRLASTHLQLDIQGLVKQNQFQIVH